MSQFYKDSIFWIEVNKIRSNPFQPRKEFDQAQLESLADSIKQYGVLQALVVTRKEVPKDDGGLSTEYELIAGERRLRASKIAGLYQVPVLIKTGQDDDLMKLELALIENVQREDLNPIERARAFQKLAADFNFKHVAIAKKIGKSREYVSNSIRILALPEEMLKALEEKKINEGHTRPLLMLSDRPEEQRVLFKEIIYKKLNVRECEQIARKIAFERARKRDEAFSPEIAQMEDKLSESFGTRVRIEKGISGGKVTISFFSDEDLQTILDTVKGVEEKSPTDMLDKFAASHSTEGEKLENQEKNVNSEEKKENKDTPVEDSQSLQNNAVEQASEPEKSIQSRPTSEQDDEMEDELYSIKNFNI